MNTRKQAQCRGVALAVVLALLVTGCAVKRETNTMPVSPWEKVMVANAMLAETNNAVARASITLNATGILSTQQTTAVLNGTEAFAVEHKRLTEILVQGPQSDTATMDMVLDAMKVALKQVMMTDAMSQRDPQTQALLGAEVDAMFAMIDNIRTMAKQAKGGTQ